MRPMLISFVVVSGFLTVADAQAQPPPDKRFTFQPRSMSWNKALEWLSDATGMTITVEHEVVGTLTVISPKIMGKPRQYTFPELLDLFNENLQKQRARIVRRGNFLALISSQEKIDHARVPRLTPADLVKFGRTEPVAVVVPFKNLHSEKIAPALRRLLGPGGEVEVLADMNALLLCDDAGNVERVLQILASLEKAPPTLPSGKTTDVAHAQPAEKKYAFELRAARWMSVFEWLTDRTGLPVVGDHGLASLVFIGPIVNKEPVLYTIPEIIDLLNEELLAKNHLLIRRAGVLQIVTADVRVPPNLVPHIEVGELPRFGKTELVSLTLALQAVGGVNGAKEIKRLKGPFGEVVVLEDVQRVVLQDTAGNLRKILAVLADGKTMVDKTAQKPQPHFIDALKYVRLDEIARTDKGFQGLLRDMLQEDHRIPLRAAPEDVVLKLGSELAIELTMRIRVLRVEARDVYFRWNRQVFVMHVGDLLHDVLARPLGKEEVRKLGLASE